MSATDNWLLTASWLVWALACFVVRNSGHNFENTWQDQNTLLAHAQSLPPPPLTLPYISIIKSRVHKLNYRLRTTHFCPANAGIRSFT